MNICYRSYSLWNTGGKLRTVCWRCVQVDQQWWQGIFIACFCVLYIIFPWEKVACAKQSIYSGYIICSLFCFAYESPTKSIVFTHPNYGPTHLRKPIYEYAFFKAALSVHLNQCCIKSVWRKCEEKPERNRHSGKDGTLFYFLRIFASIIISGFLTLPIWSPDAFRAGDRRAF